MKSKIFALALVCASFPFPDGSAMVAIVSMGNRPADDLQTVYEKFQKRPMNTPQHYEHYDIVQYFALIGDTDSMKVLIEYGCNIEKASYQMYSKPIVLASSKSQYEMVRFLASHGAKMPTEEWVGFMAALEYRNRDSNYFLKDTSVEKIETLGYLLDHGTSVNHCKYPPLLSAIAMTAKDESEYRYKWAIIQMLIDRGASLGPG